MADTIDELADQVRYFEVTHRDAVVRALLLIARILLAMWLESKEVRGE
jgi:hypothetical protein